MLGGRLRQEQPHLAGVEITHRWGGPFSVTADLTPALGYLGEERDAVYAVGCIGHGVSMSFRNGQVLAQLLLGASDDAAFRDCRSPKNYKHLKPGKHRFEVYAVAPTGAVDETAARVKFKVKHKGKG